MANRLFLDRPISQQKRTPLHALVHFTTTSLLGTPFPLNPFRYLGDLRVQSLLGYSKNGSWPPALRQVFGSGLIPVSEWQGWHLADGHLDILLRVTSGNPGALFPSSFTPYVPWIEDEDCC